MGEKVKGYLLLIGGAERKEGDRVILRRLVELLKQRESYLVILTTATSAPGAVGKEYQSVFGQLGLKDIKLLHINSRNEAAADNNASLLAKAGGIFFTGGDQLRLTSLLGGSAVNRALKQAYQNGVLIAGTSAGASVVSNIMIIGGEDDQTPQAESVQLAPGLGLLEEVVVDQHFAQRGRLGRLLSVVAYNPYIIGVGIDEDTAVEINDQACFIVRGSRTVTIIDGQEVSHSNIYGLGKREPLALLNVKVHVLPAGYSFDLRNRKVRYSE